MKSKQLLGGHRRLGLVAVLVVSGWLLGTISWQAGSGLGLLLGMSLMLTGLIQFIFYARR